jgi:hypothetical protein
VINKGQYFDYIGHQFVMRQQPVPAHILQQAICLDDYLDVPEYETVKDALEAGLGNPIGGEPTGQTFDPPAPGYAPAPVFGTPEPQCPFAEYGGVLGKTLDNWEECGTCSLRSPCEAVAPPAPVQQPTQAPKPTAAPTAIAPRPAPQAGPIPRRPQR